MFCFIIYIIFIVIILVNLVFLGKDWSSTYALFDTQVREIMTPS